MEEQKQSQKVKYFWLVAVVLATIALAGFAAYHNYAVSGDVGRWYAPLGYLFLVALFGSIHRLNRPVAAIITLGIYGLSVFLLVAQIPGVEWEYPLGLGLVVLLFL